MTTRRPVGARGSLLLSAILAVLVGGCTAAAPASPAATSEATPTADSAPSSAPTAMASPALTHPPSPQPATTPDPGTPLGDRLLATITADLHPCAMAVTADAVWVTSYQGNVDRIDPATNAVTAQLDVGGQLCGIAVADDGAIWIADLSGRIVRLDPASGAVTATIDGVGPQLWDLKSGDGAVWAIDRDAHRLLRIDPATARITARVPIGPSGAGLAVLPGGVWVADDVDGKVRKVDPKRAKVVASVDVGGGPTWFADDGTGNLLVAERLAGRVVVIDPQTGALGAALDGWNQPLDGTVVDGQAWIPDGGAGVVRVVDLADATVTSSWPLPGAHQPFVAEPAFEDVWVLDFGGTSVWRIRP